MPAEERPESLRDIARWLTVAASCGVFLSARDLRRIGEGAGIHGLPVNRRFAVEQLFRAAALEERMDALFDSLLAEISAHRTAYEECDTPALSPWIERSSATLERLEQMRQTWLAEFASQAACDV